MYFGALLLYYSCLSFSSPLYLAVSGCLYCLLFLARTFTCSAVFLLFCSASFACSSHFVLGFQDNLAKFCHLHVFAFFQTLQYSFFILQYFNLIINILGTFALKDRISSGGSATEGQFPFIASLQVFRQHLCGGSIITPRHILTAAHCLK